MPKKVSNVKFIEPKDLPLDIHPLAEKIPPMSEAQFQDGLQFTKAAGKIFNPGIVLKGELVDCRHRMRWCMELELPFPVREFDPKIDGDLERFIEAQNEIRRHEEPEVLANRRYERRMRIAEKKKEGKSDRQIAKEEGISQSQVQRDLKKASQLPPPGSTEPDSETVTGTDGKKYKPRKTVAQKKAAKEGADRKRKEKKAQLKIADVPEAEELQDAMGESVPEVAISAFRIAPKIDEIVAELDAMRPRLRKLGEECDQWEHNAVDAIDYVSELIEKINELRPYRVCPECEGKLADCQHCHGHGWISGGDRKDRIEDASERVVNE
jgi:hypothetical protein